MKKLYKILPLALSSCLIFACASAPSSITRAGDESKASIPDVPTSWASVQETVGEVQIGWIEQLGDLNLIKLVEEAQANNNDLKASAAGVERSLALAKQAGAALTPNLALSAGTQQSGGLSSSAGSANLNVGLQASWEPDLWGRIRSGEQAALASASAAQADYTFTQYSIAAGVAKAYFISIEAERQEELTEEIVKALTETTRIVKVQYDNGLASGQDLSLVRSDLSKAQEQKIAASAGKRDALRALEILLGRYPSAEVDLRNTLPTVPALAPAGLPSDLLERRPDIIAAERRIAAAIKNVDQAKAAKLPSLSLSGSLGNASTSLSDLLKPSNLVWQAASSLLVPLIGGKAGNAQVEVNTADQKAAVAAYAQAALTAFGEVETALDQGVVLRDRRNAIEESFTEIENALRIANLRYEEGETDLLDVLSIQQRKFGAQSSLISLQRNQLEQFINLNLALGGDW